MARSLKKGPFADHHLLAKVEKIKQRSVGEEQVLFTKTLSMQSIGKEITQWLVV